MSKLFRNPPFRNLMPASCDHVFSVRTEPSWTPWTPDNLCKSPGCKSPVINLRHSFKFITFLFFRQLHFSVKLSKTESWLIKQRNDNKKVFRCWSRYELVERHTPELGRRPFYEVRSRWNFWFSSQLVAGTSFLLSRLGTTNLSKLSCSSCRIVASPTFSLPE